MTLKPCCDLETRVRGHSRSMAYFNGSYM